MLTDISQKAEAINEKMSDLAHVQLVTLIVILTTILAMACQYFGVYDLLSYLILNLLKPFTYLTSASLKASD